MPSKKDEPPKSSRKGAFKTRRETHLLAVAARLVSSVGAAVPVDRRLLPDLGRLQGRGAGLGYFSLTCFLGRVRVSFFF